jgi:agmatinase
MEAPKVGGGLKENQFMFDLRMIVLDPAYALDRTQEPGGCSSREIIEAVHMLDVLNVVGFDLVEVCPQLDYSERTAILAAKIVREMILMHGK